MATQETAIDLVTSSGSSSSDELPEVDLPHARGESPLEEAPPAAAAAAAGRATTRAMMKISLTCLITDEFESQKSLDRIRGRGRSRSKMSLQFPCLTLFLGRPM
ncbi:hypothetical protein V7S43_002999 [Phytophthora oleae]|uniref:PiggyBac transposable element-derived protein domain-containing protein n=1 Tax=Phytophthora oleae TaxID=2107226 RepID=A0ABD3FZY7_9STRA